MIKLFRVDDKLSHGQTTYSWVKKLQVDTILIADDRVVLDEVSKVFLKFAKPPATRQHVVTVDQAAVLMEAYQSSKDNVFVITGSIESAMRLLTKCTSIRHVNIGAIRNHPNAKAYADYVYLDEYEVECCRELMRAGIKIDLRLAYEHEPMMLESVL